MGHARRVRKIATLRAIWACGQGQGVIADLGSDSPSMSVFCDCGCCVFSRDRIYLNSVGSPLRRTVQILGRIPVLSPSLPRLCPPLPLSAAPPLPESAAAW